VGVLPGIGTYKHDVNGGDKGLNLKGCSWTPAGSDGCTCALLCRFAVVLLG
jgi:hypothetical protein